MTAAVLIRSAEEEDVEVLFQVIEDAYRHFDGWTTEASYVKGSRIQKDELRRVITESHDTVLVAIDPTDDTPIGCVRIETHKEHPEYVSQDEAIIGLFSVSPAHQSKGIGSALFKAALAHAKNTMGVSQAVVWVIHLRDDLIPWYERMGFVWKGETRPFEHSNVLVPIHFKVFRKDLTQ